MWADRVVGSELARLALAAGAAEADLRRLAAGWRAWAAAADGWLTVLHGEVLMNLVDGGDGVVAVAEAEMPVLTADLVRETLERTRR
jgi:hypothetical protein